MGFLSPHLGRCSSSVERQLPKLERRVRFPSSAFFIVWIHEIFCTPPFIPALNSARLPTPEVFFMQEETRLKYPSCSVPIHAWSALIVNGPIHPFSSKSKLYFSFKYRCTAMIRALPRSGCSSHSHAASESPGFFSL